MEQRAQTLDRESDYDRYKTLLELWSKENPIKTTKLQVLLAVNALLASVSALGDGFTSDKSFVYAAGFVFSLVWTFSIGRTSLFQEAWNRKLNKLAAAYPDDPSFHIHDTRRECKESPLLLQRLGGIPSKWYLLFVPPAFAFTWLVVLVVANI